MPNSLRGRTQNTYCGYESAESFSHTDRPKKISPTFLSKLNQEIRWQLHDGQFFLNIVETLYTNFCVEQQNKLPVQRKLLARITKTFEKVIPE